MSGQTAEGVRSLPLEGSQLVDQPGHVGDLVPGSLITPGGIATGLGPYPPSFRKRVRSLPLEGSQPLSAHVTAAYLNMFAHYPWRDRNAVIVELVSWTLSASQTSSLITPGGIATSPSPPRPDGQSPGSLITPGGIATRHRHGAGEARGRGFAHYPWRDRNATSPPDSMGPPASSLITPGGIATCRAARAQHQSVGFAHYPWRDRNRRRSWARSRSSSVRSLPLEGSQRKEPLRNWLAQVRFAHYPWRDRNAIDSVKSTISSGLFAHYPWRDRNVYLRSVMVLQRKVRSLPLEGSQRRWVEDDDSYRVFAHYPWRDRNMPTVRPGLDADGVRSLPLEGSQPESSLSVTRTSSVFAHYPWRDRNMATLT